jgi:hypothetical protein
VLVFVCLVVVQCIGFQLPLIISTSTQPPGFDSQPSLFNDPYYLKMWGFNGQVLSQSIEFAVQWSAVSPDIFPANSESLAWLQTFQDEQNVHIAAAKAQGLSVIYTNDLIIWPTNLVNMFKSDITDSKGHISIDKPKTLELLGIMFDELVSRFPQVDGYMIRVGETYLPGPGSSYFTGNGAIDYTLPAVEQQNQYIKLINFLRQKLCVQYNKLVIFRTWDTAGFSPQDSGRFHSNLTYYLNITNQIEPHPNLIFSIKHTALDFWRFVQWNPCLTQGKHKQIVEVECQREYEGKGSFPNYIGNGVINGFSELIKPIGLKDIVKNPQIVGLWTWARGGGWNGPYINGVEIFPRINARVISTWYSKAHSSNPIPTEEDIFLEICSTDFELSSASCTQLYNLSLISQDAVLHMRYCTPYDQSLKNMYLPTANWLRDDCLGGISQLNGGNGKQWNDVISYLYNNGKMGDSLLEKQTAINEFDEMQSIAQNITDGNSDPTWKLQLVTLTEYGSFLSRIVFYGWQILLTGYEGDVTGNYNIPLLKEAIQNYDISWGHYNAFTSSATYTSSPFCGCYERFFSNGTQPQPAPGLNDSVDKYRKIISI